MSVSHLPRFLKGQGRDFKADGGGLAPGRRWLWLAWPQETPRPACVLHYYVPLLVSHGAPQMFSVCARAAQVASRIPSLAIHAPHSGPCVRLWVVDLHSAQP